MQKLSIVKSINILDAISIIGNFEKVFISNEGKLAFHGRWLIHAKTFMAVIPSFGLAFIYLGYKLLGKFGAIAVFIIEAGLFVVANDLLPFSITILK